MACCEFIALLRFALAGVLGIEELEEEAEKPWEPEPNPLPVAVEPDEEELDPWVAVKEEAEEEDAWTEGGIGAMGPARSWFKA